MAAGLAPASAKEPPVEFFSRWASSLEAPPLSLSRPRPSAPARVPPPRPLVPVSCELAGLLPPALAALRSKVQNHRLLAHNQELKGAIADIGSHQTDVYVYIHEKLDEYSDQIAAYEQRVAELEAEAESLRSDRDRDIAKGREDAKQEILRLTQEVDSLQDELARVQEFQTQREEVFAELDAVRAALKQEQRGREEDRVSMERTKIAEKQRLKDEMLRRVQEAKESILADTVQQLNDTTKRTLAENEQMTTELAYQSREVEKLIDYVGKLEAKSDELRRQLSLQKGENDALTRRNHALEQMVRALHRAARSKASGAGSGSPRAAGEAAAGAAPAAAAAPAPLSYHPRGHLHAPTVAWLARGHTPTGGESKRAASASGAQTARARSPLDGPHAAAPDAGSPPSAGTAAPGGPAARRPGRQLRRPTSPVHAAGAGIPALTSSTSPAAAAAGSGRQANPALAQQQKAQQQQQQQQQQQLGRHGQQGQGHASLPPRRPGALTAAEARRQTRTWERRYLALSERFRRVKASRDALVSAQGEGLVVLSGVLYAQAGAAGAGAGDSGGGSGSSGSSGRFSGLRGASAARLLDVVSASAKRGGAASALRLILRALEEAVEAGREAEAEAAVFGGTGGGGGSGSGGNRAGAGGGGGASTSSAMQSVLVQSVLGDGPSAWDDWADDDDVDVDVDVDRDSDAAGAAARALAGTGAGTGAGGGTGGGGSSLARRAWDGKRLPSGAAGASASTLMAGQASPLANRSAGRSADGGLSSSSSFGRAKGGATSSAGPSNPQAWQGPSAGDSMGLRAISPRPRGLDGPSLLSLPSADGSSILLASDAMTSSSAVSALRAGRAAAAASLGARAAGPGGKARPVAQLGRPRGPPLKLLSSSTPGMASADTVVAASVGGSLVAHSQPSMAEVAPASGRGGVPSSATASRARPRPRPPR